MGTTPMEGRVICLDRLGLTGKAKPEDFIAEYEAETKKMCHKIELMPGAESLIRHLSGKNVPTAIATGSSQPGFYRKTQHLREILRLSYINHHVFAGIDVEVKRAKPEPDVFLVAAKRFKNPLKDMRNVLGCCKWDKAAPATSMQVVFVLDKKIDLNTISVKTILILESLDHFKSEFSLPALESSHGNNQQQK